MWARPNVEPCPHKGPVMRNCECVLCCEAERDVEQADDLLMIWDAMKLIWHHCNEVTYCWFYTKLSCHHGNITLTRMTMGWGSAKFNCSLFSLKIIASLVKSRREFSIVIYFEFKNRYRYWYLNKLPMFCDKPLPWKSAKIICGLINSLRPGGISMHP